MRRALSIWLLLLFGLGPLAAVLPASDDARLPACCRRNGAHHCAMTAQMAAVLARMMAQDTTPGFTAPATCPNYPGSIVALVTPDAALAASSLSLPGMTARAHAPVAGPANELADPIRTHAGRGPPIDLLS